MRAELVVLAESRHLSGDTTSATSWLMSLRSCVKRLRRTKVRLYFHTSCSIFILNCSYKADRPDVAELIPTQKLIRLSE